MATAKRPLSKKEQEDIKKKDDLIRSAEVFSDFIQAFEKPEAAKSFTTFVRGGVVNAGKGEEHHGLTEHPTEKVYAPKPKCSRARSRSRERFSSHPTVGPLPVLTALPLPSKPALVKKQKDKKKSNLEIFKEELKQIQEEREERKRLKDQISKIETKLGTTVSLPPSAHSVFLDDDLRVFDGTYDLSGDASSTNLYMGNIAPNISEEQLCEIFGKFGPIASVKIMYPRGEDREEVRSAGRSTLCGFVAFMCRVDAERALTNLRGKEVMGYEMRLGWGKAVNIPTFPIYVPPKLAAMLEAPQSTGLPFNAQPRAEDEGRLPEETDPPLTVPIMEEILSRSTVRVTQPKDRTLLAIIHRVIEFVVREGPIFEAMLMQREKGNPMYRFLFDNRCNEHVYYRWKLFSVLQGDTPTQWKMKEFKMFEGGPMWKPPPMNPFTQGMPEDLVTYGDDPRYVKENETKKKKGLEDVVAGKPTLTDEDRSRLEKTLDQLDPSRNSVADAMLFCIDHSEVADEIIAAICKSLASPHDLPLKKVAKIYLISDILHNCSSVHVQNAWYYRNGFEQKFPYIFTQINKSHKSIEGRLKAEQYKQRVMNCFRAWEDWALYPPKYLIRLQNIFLGLEVGEEADEEVDGKPLVEAAVATPLALSTLVVPATDVDLDGVPMEEDVDGEPMEESLTMAEPPSAPVAFAPSRWETVDPEQVKAQAITTSKWDQLDPTTPDPSEAATAAQTAKSIDDHVREKLREIEVRVLKYQDDLENGKRKRHTGETVITQVEKYRKQLLNTSSTASSSATTAPSEGKKREKRTRRSRSRSPIRPRTPPIKARSPPPAQQKSRSPLGRHARISPPRDARTVISSRQRPSSSKEQPRSARVRSRSKERERARRGAR